MSIKETIHEMDRIKAVIARNNQENRALRKRLGVLEKDISEYLQENAQGGVKYNGRSIVVETKESHTRKGKADKQRDVISLLSDLGVSNPESAYSELLRAQKGEVVERKKLKINNIIKD